MTVTFDMFLFKESYIEEIKKKERMKNPAPEEESELEIGAIACRNAGRPQPIFFYDVSELSELLAAGYAVGQGREARRERLGGDDFPSDSVIPTIIELDKPVAGRFIDPDGRESTFSTRKEPSEIVEAHLPTAARLSGND